MPSAPPRLLSLDVHRGLVVAAMIFVNYLGTLPHIPPLLLHADERPDTITLPDLVFPGFLLIVGLAIPLSFASAASRGVPLARALLHIALRTLGLVLAGVVLEFHQTLVPANTGMSELTWILLFYAGFVLTWQRYPATLRAPRALGIALLVFLLVSFRGPARTGGGYEWLQHEWWGILGIIGWSYLATSLLYLAVRGRPLRLAGCLVGMIALYIVSRHDLVRWLDPRVNGLFDVGALFGSSSANVMLGALAGALFLELESPGRRLKRLLALAATAVLCGFLLRPLHGFSKNNATESYTLVTGGLQLALFCALYFAVDVREARRWAMPFAHIGQNALLAYLLPDICERLGDMLHLRGLAQRYLWAFSNATLPGQIVNTAAVTALVLTLCLLLTRWGVKLRF